MRSFVINLFTVWFLLLSLCALHTTKAIRRQYFVLWNFFSKCTVQNAMMLTTMIMNFLLLIYFASSVYFACDSSHLNEWCTWIMENNEKNSASFVSAIKF